MVENDISAKANFAAIRYAQLWEDADVLLPALAAKRGATLVSICSAGDNALALLTCDPARVIAYDLSPAQLECLKIRIAAFRLLDHAELLGLMGSRQAADRGALFDRAAATLSVTSQAFWAPRRDLVVAHGLGGIGKFERYFRLFRRYLLPLVHDRATIDALLASRPQTERERFLQERWSTWRWRLLMSLFFSRFTMGRLGRDPAFFDQAKGSVAAHVARRIVHAGVDLDPAENPFLHWILRGTHGAALPLAWREENFAIIRDRLDRLDLRLGPIDAVARTSDKIDGFNLSDIFEYMDDATFAAVYGRLLDAATRGARLAYWNMMVPRRLPAAFAPRVRGVPDAERSGKAADKAFFYSDFVVEEVL
jgi:S-adenosylmethionine-diacylglycerol 3-amino-3-carboxypropyl transferase